MSWSIKRSATLIVIFFASALVRPALAQDVTVAADTPVSLTASSHPGAPTNTPCGPDNSSNCSGGTLQPNGNINWTVDGAPSSVGSITNTVKSSSSYCSADDNVNYYTYCYSYWDESTYTALLAPGDHVVTASIPASQDPSAAFTQTWTVRVTAPISSTNMCAQPANSNLGSIKIQGNESNNPSTGIWDSNFITVSINGTSKTVSYGQFSTPGSIASAIGALFSSDCTGPALAQGTADGNLYVKIRGGGPISQLCIDNHGSASFSGVMSSSVSPSTIIATIGQTQISRGDSTNVDVQVSCNSACGQVAYLVDGTQWATVNLDANGHGSAATPASVAPGTHQVIAKFLGSSSYMESTSNALSFTTTSSPTSITATIGSIQVLLGHSTNVDVQVSCNSACGQVAYWIDGVQWATLNLDGSGHASAQTSSDLAPGLHNVVVKFLGGTDYAESISNAVSFTMSTSSTSLGIYSYTISSYAPNGNVQAYSDSVNGTWNNIRYDQLNRLTSAQYALPSGAQYMCWSYDSFGNRQAQVLSSGPCDNPPADTSFNQSNQIIGRTYDASGNLTDNDNYLYDAEGRVCAVRYSPMTGMSVMMGYIYDAEGRRVAKGAITQWSCDMDNNGFSEKAGYLLGPSGEQVVETDSQGAWVHTNVFANGELIATYTPDNLAFHLNDWLGTRRMDTDPSGSPGATYQSKPFGEMFDTEQTFAGTEHFFTGKERDTESGLDYFGARYYVSNMGRFMSPDWAAQVEPVPYAKLDNPQTLDLYAYVNNNPLSYRDLDGHCGHDGSGNTVCPDHGYAGPPPKNADGTNAAPNINLPNGKKGEANGWKMVKDNPNGKRVKWAPIYPIPGSQPSASWNENQGWWSLNDGKGGAIQHVTAEGNLLDGYGKPVLNSDGSPAKPSLMQGSVNLPGVPGFGSALDLGMRAIIFAIQVQRDLSDVHVPPPPVTGGTPGFPAAPPPVSPVIFAVP